MINPLQSQSRSPGFSYMQFPDFTSPGLPAGSVISQVQRAAGVGQARPATNQNWHPPTAQAPAAPQDPWAQNYGQWARQQQFGYSQFPGMNFGEHDLLNTDLGAKAGPTFMPGMNNSSGSTWKPQGSTGMPAVKPTVNQFYQYH